MALDWLKVHAPLFMKKPKVHIEARNGWLKLRWSHRGNRHEFTLGLPDGTLNRKVAERKASEIEMDIAPRILIRRSTNID